MTTVPKMQLVEYSCTQENYNNKINNSFLAAMIRLVALFLVFAVAGATAPVTLPVRDYNTVSLLVENQWRQLAVRFNKNASQLDFEPQFSPPVAYLGIIPLTFPHEYGPPLLALGPRSEVWKHWDTATLTPTTLLFGASAESHVRPHCVWKPLAQATLILDLGRETSSVPPHLLATDPLYLPWGEDCYVTVRQSDFVDYGPTGLRTNTLRRGVPGSPVILGRALVQQYFVVDIVAGTPVRAAPALESRRAPLVLSLGGAYIVCLLISASMLELPTRPWHKTLIVSTLIVNAVLVTVACTLPDARALAELYVQGGSTLLLIALVWAWGALFVRSVHATTSSGFVALWVLSFSDPPDLTGDLYRCLWPVLLALFHGVLAYHRKSAALLALFFCALGLAVWSGLYPLCQTMYGPVPGLWGPMLLFWTVSLIVIPLVTIQAYLAIKQAKHSGFRRDILYPFCPKK